MTNTRKPYTQDERRAVVLSLAGIHRSGVVDPVARIDAISATIEELSALRDQVIPVHMPVGSKLFKTTLASLIEEGANLIHGEFDRIAAKASAPRKTRRSKVGRDAV